MDLGKTTVGFINPILYKSKGIFANDIVNGDNTCFGLDDSDSDKCCIEGFYSTVGWDPVTGIVVCMCVYVCMCMYDVCVCVCVYVCVCVCEYDCIYVLYMLFICILM